MTSPDAWPLLQMKEDGKEEEEEEKGSMSTSG